MKHIKCGGEYVRWRIPEHHYNFLRCDKCGNYFGKTEQEVKRLMQIKVKPHLERA